MTPSFRMASIVALLCLAGCDGYMKIDGHVEAPNGTPLADVPIYLFVDGKADESYPVLWSDGSGHFEIGEMSCTCDFPVELIAVSPDSGIARYATTHKALENDSRIVMRLAEKPKPPQPAVQAKPPSCPPDKASHP